MSDSPHVAYWKNTLAVTPVVTLSGYSRAAENTGFYCRELELALDAGVPTNDLPSVICLTHLHNDHMCNLHKLLIDNPKKPIIVIPDNDKFAELLTQTLKLIYLSSKFIHPNSQKGINPQVTYPYRLLKLKVDESYMFKETRTGNYYVEGLPASHGVEAMSFGIYQMRKRCKPEYQNLNSTDYIQLKAQKVEFTEHYKYPILCYMSDTNPKPLELQTSSIYSYPNIVIECTFLEPEDLSHAKKKNHMHWQHLLPVIKSHPSTKFILIHFSKKYTWDQVKKFFHNYQTTVEYIPNIIIWLHSGVIDYTINTGTNTETNTETNSDIGSGKN
jgi:ribonuclease Z